MPDPCRSFGQPDAPTSVVVRDPAMQAVYSLVERIAGSNISVLISGETGVGKELVAEAVHRQSGRRSAGPYERINCAALAEARLESELLSTALTPFRGPRRTQSGLLEATQLSTLFLDEVGELSLGSQAKLLRVLESSLWMRAASRVSPLVSVRFVAASNRDLQAEVARGAFRKDLFFRLAGVRILIPPLRERRSEIDPLTEKVALATTNALGRPPATFSKEARVLLRRYSWPGNIRELCNVVESAVLRCEGDQVTPEDLPEELRDSTGPMNQFGSPEPELPAVSALPELSQHQRQERQRIIEGIAACNGNQTRAAALLGMPRRTLVYKLTAYAIPRPRS